MPDPLDIIRFVEMEYHLKLYDRTSFSEVAGKFAFFPTTLTKPFTHPPDGELPQKIERLKEGGFARTVQADEASKLSQSQAVWRKVKIREGFEILNVQIGNHRQYGLRKT